jgi:peroxiredoxin
MLLSTLFVITHLLAAGLNPSPSTLAPTQELQRSRTLRMGPAEPPVAIVDKGDPAPNFSYQSYDGRWRHLRDLVDKGAVLLVFAPRNHHLVRIERERQRLLDLGVLPVVILDVKQGTARSQVRRMELTYTVLADPRNVIASQFNVVDPITQGAIPSWFVIDRRRKVRALGRGSLPIHDYPAVAARALSLALPGSVLPSSR